MLLRVRVGWSMCMESSSQERPILFSRTDVASVPGVRVERRYTEATGHSDCPRRSSKKSCNRLGTSLFLVHRHRRTNCSTHQAHAFCALARSQTRDMMWSCRSTPFYAACGSAPFYAHDRAARLFDRRVCVYGRKCRLTPSFAVVCWQASTALRRLRPLRPWRLWFVDLHCGRQPRGDGLRTFEFCHVHIDRM